MKLLVIGPRQSALAESAEGRARQTMQHSQVERYAVLTPRAGEGNFVAARRMARESRQEEFDTVSAQDPFWAGLIALWIARRRGARLNVQVHADLAGQPFIKHILAQVVLRHADSVRVVSEKIKKQAERAGAGVPITVLPIYIDVSRFRTITREAHEGKNIVWVGRFEREKDPLLALRILKEVRQTIPDARLVMLGDGSLGGELRTQAAGLPVEFPGWQDPAPYLARADAVLSTSPAESFGVSIIEALAAGIPVVAPDVGVAREAGAVVSPRKRLAEALVEVLRSGVRGRLTLPLLSAEEWSRVWRASL